MLPWFICIPYIFGLLCWQCERLNIKISHWIAIFNSLMILIISSIMLLEKHDYIPEKIFDISPQWKKEYCINWIPKFGINIHLAIDGFSLLMIFLTSLLATLAILCAWNKIKHYRGFFYFSILFLLGSMIGVFLAIDMFLFFFFWEVILIPIYFLIVLLGYKNLNNKICITVANKFFIYSQISGLLMLISIISIVVVHFQNTGILTFDYNNLLNTSMSKKTELLIMLGFFIAFAIKLPLVPLHDWLPDVHNHTSTNGSIDLIGLLPKIASYGLLRFSLPLFPYASNYFSYFAIWIGVMSIFYTALIAFSQNDFKRLISYMNISHMGFILIALYSGSKLAQVGMVIQIISHTLSIAGMFIICGQLYDRFHTFDMRLMHGLWDKLNYIPAALLFFTLSNIGLPGTGNFIGELIILIGSFSTIPIPTMIAAFSLIFSSVYSLIMVKRVCFGKSESNKIIKSVSLRECITIFTPIILIIFFGLYPKFIIDIIYIPIDYIHTYL